MTESERLTIDEIIEHCHRSCEGTEIMASVRGQKRKDITSKGYWEHYQVANYLEELKQYRAIGTVSEFRELKEKAIKKIERYKDKHYCECGCPVEIMLDGVTLKPIGGQIYCDQCGAKLDWSDFVESAEAEKGAIAWED